jgi:hypothetical protein
MKRLRYVVETAIMAAAVMLFFSSLAWLINEHYLRSLFAIVGAIWVASAWGLIQASKRLATRRS